MPKRSTRPSESKSLNTVETYPTGTESPNFETLTTGESLPNARTIPGRVETLGSAESIADSAPEQALSETLTTGESFSNNNVALFEPVISMIEAARTKALRAVNRELIDLYWSIGEYVSQNIANSVRGKSVVNEFSAYIRKHYVGITGFSPQNIWRMKQFYETYCDDPKLSTLLREITWTNNILILGSRTPEEREFYLRLAAKNGYSKRELERQMDSALFYRAMISNEVNKDIIPRNIGLTALRDSYVLEFLDLPDSHHEDDLRKAIVANLKNFILEFGKGFTLVGEEYRVQVGDTDFKIDLLFFNRELQCLVAVELKIGAFKPEHLGQLEFYLEALDRDVKHPHENPSVGLILCTKKNATIVEYALSRSMSPALIADYQLHLPDKEILARKLQEIAQLAEAHKELGDE